MQDGGMSAIQASDEVVSAAEHKALQKKVKQLEQLLGRKAMETEILKEALEIAQSKKLISRMLLRATRRFPVKCFGCVAQQTAIGALLRT